MKLTEEIIDYVCERAEEVKHGKLIIEIEGKGDERNVDVIVSDRKRFQVEPANGDMSPGAGVVQYTRPGGEIKDEAKQTITRIKPKGKR